jgi:hypothetical protein
MAYVAGFPRPGPEGSAPSSRRSGFSRLRRSRSRRAGEVCAASAPSPTVRADCAGERAEGRHPEFACGPQGPIDCGDEGAHRQACAAVCGGPGVMRADRRPACGRSVDLRSAIGPSVPRVGDRAPWDRACATDRRRTPPQSRRRRRQRQR